MIEQHTRLVVMQVVVEAHIQLEVVAEVDIAEQLVELQVVAQALVHSIAEPVVVVRIVEQFDKVIPYLWQLAVHIAMLRHHEYSQQNQLQ